MFAGASLVFASAVLLLITSGKAIDIPVSSIGVIMQISQSFFLLFTTPKTFWSFTEIACLFLCYFCAVSANSLLDGEKL